MSEQRYHMETIDGQRFVEMPNTILGRDFMVGLRKGRSDLFKSQRIHVVPQTKPSDVQIGVLHLTFS